jgi:hypothetical protein
MNKRYPTRKQALPMLSFALIMAILFQVLSGWDPKVFCLSLLINTMAVVIVWRYRMPAALLPGQRPGSGRYRFFARTVFWILVAVVLFFGIRISR